MLKSSSLTYSLFNYMQHPLVLTKTGDGSLKWKLSLNSLRFLFQKQFTQGFL